MDNYIERVLERMGDRQERHDPPVDLLSAPTTGHILARQDRISPNADGSVTLRGGEWLQSSVAVDTQEVR